MCLPGQQIYETWIVQESCLGNSSMHKAMEPQQGGGYL